MFFWLFPILNAALSFRDDSDLIRRLKNREPEAMTELYDRYGRLAYAVIARVVRDRAIAEDLTQEAFLRIWTRIAVFDSGRGALGPWIVTVARNRAIDYLRSVEGRGARNAVDLDRLDRPGAFVDLDARMLTAGYEHRLREAMDRLNANQREVIELAYFEGLSQTEMADKLNQPLGTVKTWVRSALASLRKEFTEAAAAT